MVVVTMTSWIKRINNVKPVIERIINGTKLPDVVYLNLSVQEFPNRENNLPQDLVKFIKDNPIIKINWVEGENTKSMKKIFPILKYLEDDDIIMCIDDDMLLPYDILESRLDDFYRYNGKFGIAGFKTHALKFIKLFDVGVTSVYSKKMLNNWEKFVDSYVIKTYHDDRTYLYIMWLNGYMNKPCSKYDGSYLLSKCDYQQNDGMFENKIHLNDEKYDKYILPRLKKLTGKDVLQSFGYFKRNKV